MPTYDEIELAALVRSLPPAPDAWVEAAKELPRTLRELEMLLPTIEGDAELREGMTRDLEGALERAGFEPEPRLLAALRRHLMDSGAKD